MDNLRPLEWKSPLEKRVRVFLGLGPPPPEWLEVIGQWSPRFNRVHQQIGWTIPGNIHLTLRFLGSISQENILTLCERLDQIRQAHREFVMESIDLTLLPDSDRPRVLAIRMEESFGHLLKLEAAVRSDTADIGQPPENRPFLPHVTIARAPKPNRRISTFLRRLWTESGPPELPAWPVDNFVLFKSDLQKGGSIYTPLHRFKLV